MGTNSNAPVWANEDMRLDPFKMPQRVSYERAAKAVEITLDNRGAVMRHELTCGLPLKIALPARAFRGVAARSIEHEDGSMTMTLELMHADPALSVPLCVSHDAEETACDWHSWSRALGLPMLMVDAQGDVSVVKDAGLAISDDPLPRRKPGRVGDVRRITAREIIART